MAGPKKTQTDDQKALQDAFDRLEKRGKQSNIDFYERQKKEHAAVCRKRDCVECKDLDVLLRYCKGEIQP